MALRLWYGGTGGNAATAASVLRRGTVRLQRRSFQTIQRGHDRPRESLYDMLGFSGDGEARRVRRTPTELRQALLRRVEELRDPAHDAKDRERLTALKDAYTLLQDDGFRARYASHHYASNDAQLHVLCDGGQVAANFNPEHQQFTYVDHAIDRDGASGLSDGNGRSGAALSSGALGGGAEAPTAEALRDAFHNATGAGDGSSASSAAGATAFKAADAAGPQKGADITHLLRLTLEQSMVGCSVEVELQKNVRCATCRGSGRQRLRTPRKCPQCLGRGSAHLPSATYHVERRCLYCGGEGTVPPPPCRACEGRGVHVLAAARAPVTVPAGTLSNSLFRLRHHGHDGVRGGHAGDLLVTVMVSEHRHFFRHPERTHELHAMLPLPLSTALLGGRVRAPTLHGHGTVHVPPCVRNGQLLPLSVYGVPGTMDATEAAQGAPHTIIYHALVMIPKVDDLSGRQRAALRVYDQEPPDAEVAVGVGVEGGTRDVAAATSTASEAPSRAAMMESCAVLKDAYKHWFTA